VRVRIGQRSHYFCPQCQSVKMKAQAGPGGVSERTGRRPA
jgi:hypothetical protein